MPACLPEQLWWIRVCGRSGCKPTSRSSSVAGALARSARTAASWSSVARCDAQAIATSASSARKLTLPVPDYEADDVLVVSEPERLRALADDLRNKIVMRLRERARSISELAEELELPKGTVGHHVKVLEKAGLIRVVRT